MQTETRTLMVIDLVGSTQLVQQASREQLLEMLEDVTQPLRQIIHEYNGMIIKFTGDGYLVTFMSASESLEAASKIVEAFNAQPTLPNGTRLEGCRVALHTSDVVVQDGDVLGEGVVTVARLEKHIPANTVYVTHTTKEIAKASEFHFEPIGELLLRGLENPVQVYRLVTDPFSGVEHDIYLTISDLVGMGNLMTKAPIEVVNRLMAHWIGLNRQVIGQSNGRLRAIVGDNLITTHHTADEAAAANVELARMVNRYNDIITSQDPAGQPIVYSSITCRGDLFVLNIGVNGPLVSRAFRLLSRLPSGVAALEPAVFADLAESHHAAFQANDPNTPDDLYHLISGVS
jgi:class 3 adenylate cyclase